MQLPEKLSSSDSAWWQRFNDWRVGKGKAPCPAIELQHREPSVFDQEGRFDCTEYAIMCRGKNAGLIELGVPGGKVKKTRINIDLILTWENGPPAVGRSALVVLGNAACDRGFQTGASQLLPAGQHVFGELVAAGLFERTDSGIYSIIKPLLHLTY